ncbi:MAG: hypothetical protein KGO02_19785, partial [Alphaproteobacteria bacterium]|nr:hypothetical protein [Alphaproteobacteria bacterium]
MGNARTLTRSRATLQPQEPALARLFAPLPHLLIDGGDLRLRIDPIAGCNDYGCRPTPDGRVLAFSSSTATTISEPAYQRAHMARQMLVHDSLTQGMARAFDSRVESMRHDLRTLLRLEARIGVMFSPSGTDSQLQALLLLRHLLGGRLCSIVIGADQTGRGTIHTARGQHFSDRTAQGCTVVKGEPVARWANAPLSVGISLLADDGSVRSEAQTDALVLATIAEQIDAGCNVLLQIMESSKLGWRAPSDSCLDEIAARWPQRVQVVVDACQMRMPRSRLSAHLSRGRVVLMTGSKFFTGPSFSGASLWPQQMHARITACAASPEGLSDYATCYDLPPDWTGLRSGLPSSPNVGQWLRWEAALAEMDSYYAVPAPWRHAALARLSEAVPEAIASVKGLQLLPAYGRHSPMPPTIFSFFLNKDGGRLDSADVTALYHALYRSGTCATNEPVCQIGQPVALRAGTVLRIAIGARALAQAFKEDASCGQVIADI